MVKRKNHSVIRNASPLDRSETMRLDDQVKRQEPPHIASRTDFVRMKEKARIMRDSFTQFEEHAEIMPILVVIPKAKAGETTSADEEDQVENNVGTETTDQAQNDQEAARGGPPAQSQGRMSVGQAVDLSEHYDNQVSPEDNARHEEQNFRLGALTSSILNPNSTPEQRVHIHGYHQRCESCDQVQPNAIDRNPVDDFAAVHQPGGLLMDMSRIGVSRQGASTFDPAQAAQALHITGASTAPLIDMKDFSQRIDDMGLTREASQQTFRDMRSEGGLAPALAIDSPSQTRDKYRWNNARASFAKRQRAYSSDAVVSEPIAGLGIHDVEGRRERSTSPAAAYQDTSIIPLPALSSDASEADCSEGSDVSDMEGSEELEEEEVDTADEDGILSGKECHTGAASPLSVDIFSSDDSAGVASESSSWRKLSKEDNDAMSSASESEPEMNVEPRTIRQLHDMDPVATAATCEKLTPNNVLDVNISPGGPLPRPHPIQRKQTLFEDASDREKQDREGPQQETNCLHADATGAQFPCPTCDNADIAPFRAGPQRQRSGVLGPSFKRDPLEETIRKQSLPRGVHRGLVDAASGDVETDRVVLSSSPLFQHVLEASTDAEFYLAWCAVLEDLKLRYPKCRSPTQDPKSVPHYARFIQLDRAKTESGGKTWTVEKAKREIDDQSRQKRLLERQSASASIAEEPDPISSSERVPDEAVKSVSDQIKQHPLDDISWMNDSSGVLGAKVAPKKPSSKRKKKSQKKPRAKPHSVTRPTQPTGDSESEASDVDISVLVASRVGKEETRSLTLGSNTDSTHQSESREVPVEPSAPNFFIREDQPAQLAQKSSTTPLTPAFTPEKPLFQPQDLPGSSPLMLSTESAPRVLEDSVLREAEPATQATTTHIPTQPFVGVAKGPSPAAQPFSNTNQAKLSLSLNNSVVENPAAPLAAPDAAEGAFISTHPYSGEEIVVLPGPSPRPAYERSLFVTGMKRTNGTAHEMRHILQAHFSLFYPVEKIRMTADLGGISHTAFVVVATREYALALVDKPEAKLLDYNTHRISNGLCKPDVECRDILKIEMAQGTPHLSVKLNRTWNAKVSQPPSIRAGKALPHKVIYERYLEPAYIDFAGRQRFRVRCRVALRGNAIFPMDYEQERSRRSFYPGQIIVKEPLTLDMASVSTGEAAIRLLCEPFGEMDSISPLTHLNGETEGFDVKFADRNASTRAQQQLSLLMGIICHRAPPPITTPAPEPSISEPPKQGIRSANTRPGHSQANISNLTPGGPKFARVPRLDTKRDVGSATADEWPALPSARDPGTRPTHSMVSKEQPISTASISNIEVTSQKRLESTALSPVEEEPADFASAARAHIPVVARPDQNQTADNDSSPGEGPSEPEGCLFPPSHTPEDTSLPSDPFPVNSALGLSHVPALTTSRLDTAPDLKAKHPVASTKPLSSHKSVPIVSLGSSEQRLRMIDPDPAAQRMTLEIRDVSSGETEGTLRERFKPYGRVTAVRFIKDGDGVSRCATVSYTSVASARQAAHKENGRLIGSEQSDVEQTGGGVGSNQLLSILSVNEKDQLPEIRQRSPSLRSHSPLDASGDIADQSLDTAPSDLEVTTAQVGHKRSMSDPGRDTPMIPEAEAILSDDSKSETALEDTFQRDSPACSAASVEQEVQIYPTIRSVSRTQEPDSRYWMSPAHVQSPEAEDMARRLFEANERLAQWHAWAAQNGIPMPPHMTVPATSGLSQLNGIEAAYANGQAGIPFPASQPNNVQYHHTWNDYATDSARGQDRSLGLAHRDTEERALYTPESNSMRYQPDPAICSAETARLYPGLPLTGASPDNRNAHAASGRLQPVRVIDTPQGLYALYDREELREYKKTIPHGEVSEDECAAAEPPTLYPLWSGGHPPERQSQWQTASSEAQYRQSFEMNDVDNRANETTFLPPTPRSSLLEEFDHTRNSQLYSGGVLDTDFQLQSTSYQEQLGRRSPFIHHPMPLPRPQAMEPRFNMFTPTPASRGMPNIHHQHGTARTSSVATMPNSLAQGHRFTTSVRMPSTLRQQPGTENAFASYNSSIVYLQRSGSNYRGYSGHRRGSGKRGSYFQEPHRYRDFA